MTPSSCLYVTFHYSKRIFTQNLFLSSLNGEHHLLENKGGVVEEELRGWEVLGSSLVTELTYGRGWCKPCRSEHVPNFHCQEEIVSLPRRLGVNPIPLSNLTHLVLNRKDKTWCHVSNMIKDALGLQLHNFVMKKRRFLLKSGDVITEILQSNCPVTCRIAGDEL